MTVKANNNSVGWVISRQSLVPYLKVESFPKRATALITKTVSAFKHNSPNTFFFHVDPAIFRLFYTHLTIEYNHLTRFKNESPALFKAE